MGCDFILYKSFTSADIYFSNLSNDIHVSAEKAYEVAIWTIAYTTVDLSDIDSFESFF